MSFMQPILINNKLLVKVPIPSIISKIESLRSQEERHLLENFGTNVVNTSQDTKAIYFSI